MAPDELDMTDLGREGMSTLAAQMTRRSVDRILRIIRRERERGVSDKVLAKAMERDLPDYDEHSRRLMLRLAAGGDVPDDFPPDTVAGKEEPKPNTVELTLSRVRPDVGLHSLVRYSGKEWIIMNCQESRLLLKLLH